MRPQVRESFLEQLIKKVSEPHVIPDVLPDVLPRPKDAVTLKLKGFSQADRSSCGVAAGYSVVSTLHPHASFKRFYQLCRADPKIGVTMANLRRALESSGVEVDYRRTINWDRLKAWIDGGRPVICFVHRPEEDGATTHHWLVVYGYRLDPREVFVSGNGWGAFAGGAFSLVGQHKLSWSAFKRMFNTSPSGVGGHAFVCRAKDGRTVAIARS